MIFITHENEIDINLPLQSLYFYATWMPYHNKFLAMIKKIEEKHKIPFYAIDVDQFKNQCKRFEITSIPSITVLKSGTEIKRINGLILTSAFKAIYADICKF